MSRPTRYHKIADNLTGSDRYLASCDRLYGLMYQGNMLIQVSPNPYRLQPVRKYYKNIYATLGQAQKAVARIQQEYAIEGVEIVEIAGENQINN